MADTDPTDTEQEIIESFNVTESEISALKNKLEEVAEALFDEYGIELSNELIDEIQQAFLTDLLEDMEITSNIGADVGGIFSKDKPREHLEHLQREMGDNGANVKTSMKTMVVKLSEGKHGQHPFSEFAEKQLRQNHDRNPNHSH